MKKSLVFTSGSDNTTVSAMENSHTATPRVFVGIIGGRAVLAVDARELHESLEVETRFNDWIERRIEEAMLAEGTDFYSRLSKTGGRVEGQGGAEFCYSSLSSKGRGGHNRVDFTLSIDAASHISMLERTQRGREVRQKFIDTAKEFASQRAAPALPDPRIEALEGKVEQMLAAKSTPPDAVIEALVNRIVRAEIARDPGRGLLGSTHTGAREILDAAGISAKCRRGWPGRIAQSLVSFCAAKGVVVAESDPNPAYSRKLFLNEIVQDWRTSGGGQQLLDRARESVLRKRDTSRGQLLLFPEGGRRGRKGGTK